MSLSVKKVELRYLLERKDITEEFAGNSIDITLADESVLTIELFERDGDHAIQIRSGFGVLHLTPVASNAIKIGIEK
jgi:hypothetical protein